LPISEAAERRRGPREVQRNPIGNLVGILGNPLARNLGRRMISLGGNHGPVIRKVKAKTSLAGTEVRGVAIRMDVPARRGNIKVAL